MSGSFAIRPATPADAALIAVLLREHGAQEDAEVTGSAEDYAAGLAAGAFACLIAEGPDGPAGLAMYYPTFSSWSGRRGLFLEDIYLRPGARGSGLGARLLAEVAAIAGRQGADRVDLVVQTSNPARAFYAAMGLRELPGWRLVRADAATLAALRDRGL